MAVPVLRYALARGYVVQPQDLALDADEYIVGIQGNSGKYIGSITFFTNKRKFGPFGGDGGYPFSLMAPSGYQVRGLFGRSGDFMDAVGILAEKKLAIPQPPPPR
ncbi:Jacalin-like lectin domain protein [compost metagenome]